MRMLTRLHKLATEFNIAGPLHNLSLQCLAQIFSAVIVTNQVMADTNASPLLGGDIKVRYWRSSGFNSSPFLSQKPVGGHVVAHALKTRLWLRKAQDDTRVCFIYDSPSLAEGEAVRCAVPYHSVGLLMCFLADFSNFGRRNCGCLKQLVSDFFFTLSCA